MFLAHARWAVSEHTTRIILHLHNCGAPSGSCVVYNLVAFLPFYSFAVDTFPFIWCDPNVLRIVAEYCRSILENLQKTQMASLCFPSYHIQLSTRHNPILRWYPHNPIVIMNLINPFLPFFNTLQEPLFGMGWNHIFGYFGSITWNSLAIPKG